MKLPISAAIPTCNRALALKRALESLAAQEVLPAELILVDGSKDTDSRRVVEHWGLRVASRCAVVWQPAKQLGLQYSGIRALQRPLGLSYGSSMMTLSANPIV